MNPKIVKIQSQEVDQRRRWKSGWKSKLLYFKEQLGAKFKEIEAEKSCSDSIGYELSIC